ncbi:26S proteasome non-ATPase regulatory subunit [Linderina pennispora]|nr:26S proteasome non-ATPase regulatory subunit [Linderina pennispora]
MTNNEEAASMEVELTEEQKAAEAQRILHEDLVRNVKFLERGASESEVHYIHRAMRTTFALRKRLETPVLGKVVAEYSSSDSPAVAKALEIAAAALGTGGGKTEGEAKACVPEVALYFGLLVQMHLLDTKEYAKGSELSHALIGVVNSVQRRTVDPIAGRVFFYFSRFYEVGNSLANARPTLLSALQTATLTGMKESQATLLTLLLRNYIHYRLYEQAERLAAKTAFPTDAPNSVLARYLYYMGRIEAVQLNYTAAHTHLLEATRKAASNAATAGFQQTVHKLYVIVELLMGNIPERSLFRQAILKKPLQPYLELTQAVRIGDLAQFQSVVGQYRDKFLQDQVLVLIQRLRHNVIKAGIRSISAAYSRISLRDICYKLHLDSEEDAEYIVAKAIRDGVIDATIDHERGFVKSSEIQDVYSTSDPQQAFDKRIAFCLNLHNESVVAMRYPGRDHRKDIADVNDAVRRERELAQELASEEFDDGMDDDDMMDDGL